jgi:hypothetical protein
VARGTTDEGDTSWWRTDDGRRFQELNAKLIDKKVRIERIWLLGAPPSQELLALLEEHRQLGVDVFIVRSHRKDMDGRLLVNLTLMDDTFLQMDIPNKEGQAVEYLYSENSVDIERALQTFAQLRSKAARYSGPESLKLIFEGANNAPTAN